MRAYIEHVAEKAAANAVECALASLAASQGRKANVRAAAAGDLNYASAATYIGCPKDSIRHYVFRGDLSKGKLEHTVTLASVRRFKRKYRPAPDKRRNPVL